MGQLTKQPSTSDDIARIVIDHSVDGLLVIDQDGFIRFANRAAISLFAGRTEKLVGFHLGAPAIHESVELIIPAVGDNRHVEMRSAEITWEGRAATLASLRDITERKQSAEALQASADELRERNRELMRFNQSAVGRELRMIELKKEVNELCEKLGEPPRYRVPTDVSDAPAKVSGLR
jgi:PAS domain-containing protein